MDEVPAAFLGQLGRAADQVAAATGHLDQFDAEALQSLVLGPGDRGRDDPGHREPVLVGAHRGPEGGVAHRRNDEWWVPAFAAEVFEQVGGAADLETPGRGEELALGIYRPVREQVAEADERGLKCFEHGYA